MGMDGWKVVCRSCLLVGGGTTLSVVEVFSDGITVCSRSTIVVAMAQMVVVIGGF